MSVEGFQLLNNQNIEISIIKRYFIKIYYQQGSQIHDEIQNIEFFYGENLNYIPVGDGYLDFEIKVRNADNIKFIVATDDTNEVIRLVISHLLSQVTMLEFQYHLVLI